ncbi:MAG: HAD family hydrolase [Solirubrobacteraceae bacterium]
MGGHRPTPPESILSAAAPRPPALELVIFDCDGVLVDSEPISNAVLAQALTREGLPTSAASALDEFRGLHMRDVVARSEERLGRALPAGWIESYEQARADAFRRSLVATPGAAEAVRAVIAAGPAVCVASQGRPEKTELTLSLTGLRELFGTDAVFSAYSVARGKPQPDLFLHAAAAMGARAERCAVIEDTTVGVTAAVAAGMRVLGYAAAGGADALAAAGAEVITALAEIPARLGLTKG